jgi:hypothetical protein
MRRPTGGSTVEDVGKAVRFRSPGRAGQDSILEERRKARLPYPELLELYRARESVKQALARTQDERRDDDRQFIDEAGLQELPDDIGAPMTWTSFSPAAAWACSAASAMVPTNL